MTTEFTIQGPTRRCATTGRELAAGERFYATLTDENGTFVRTDYSVDAWQGPPPQTVAFWSGRVPASDKPRKPTFNEELLFDCFQHLTGTTEPSRVNFRYVVAILLMRRKRLKFEDVRTAPDQTSFLIVRDARTGTRHEVSDPRLSEAEIEAVQSEVFQVLGWE